MKQLITFMFLSKTSFIVFFHLYHYQVFNIVVILCVLFRSCQFVDKDNPVLKFNFELNFLFCFFFYLNYLTLIFYIYLFQILFYVIRFFLLNEYFGNRYTIKFHLIFIFLLFSITKFFMSQ